MPAFPPESARRVTGPARRLRDAWAGYRAQSALIRRALWQYRRFVGAGLLALVIVDVLEVVPPYLLKEAVDTLLPGAATAAARPVTARLAQLALLYLGVASVQAVGRYGWRMYLIRSSVFGSRDLRQRFAHHLFGLAASFFDRRPIGDLMSLATNDVETVRAALGTGVLVFADAMFYFLTLPVAMFLLSPRLTLLAFVPLPIIPFVVLRNEREIHRRFERVQEAFSGISSLTQEALGGIRVTKAFAREPAQLRRLREAGDEYARRSIDLARVQTSFAPTLDFAMSLGLVLLLYVGGRELIAAGGRELIAAGGRELIGAGAGGAAATALTLGTFVAFQRYIQKMVWPMAAIGVALSTFQRAATSSRRLEEVLAVTSDVPEPAQPRLPEAADAASAPDAPPAPWRTAGRVVFRDLSFAFPGTDRPVLRGISLDIAAGERVAFVGAIGAGKSALLGLLPRLYPVARGMLELDGVDINDWPLAELRRQVGYVGQDIFLFSDTVLENVAYGLAGANWANASWTEQPATVGSIEEATQLAAVHEDILGLSGAYGTRVGERGVNLSGGQKQRLTIARAIVKEPAILVLDDALSSVDVQTEERILRGLRARPRRNTEIVAAHRISTVRDADRIVVLEGGAIAQMGTHRELLRDAGGIYRRFHDQQQLREELESYADHLEVPSAAPSSGEGRSRELR